MVFGKMQNKKIWLISRMDQASILAEHLAQKNYLVKWDSFVRFSKNNILRMLFFRNKTSRLTSKKLSQIKGTHFLPEVIGSLIKVLNFKTPTKYSDILLAILASKKPPKDFDILHGQGNYSLESAIYAQSIGKKFISDVSGHMGVTREKQLAEVHNKNKVEFNNGVPILQQRRLVEAIISDAIICPSKYVKSELIELGILEKKIFVANYDAPQAQNLINIPPRKFLASKNILSILYVGQVSYSKGVHDLINTFANLENNQNIKLELVGEVVNKDLIKYKNDKILFHGKKNHQQLYEIYTNADIFVFPSYSEGSALVTQEAMASGLPTIATHQAGSLINDNTNGLLYQAGDIKKLNELLNLLISNPALRQKLSDNGREKIKNSMKQSYGRRVEEIYNHILD